MKGKKAPPVRVVILPTNRCNLRCIFCGGVYEREAPNKWFPEPFSWKDELSEERWIEIVDEISKMGALEWLISGGGEPMMRPKLTLELMRIIKSNGAEGRLITNGTIWKRKWAEELVKLHWDHIMFSVHAADSKTEDLLTATKGSFNLAIKNIAMFSKIKKMKNSFKS